MTFKPTPIFVLLGVALLVLGGTSLVCGAAPLPWRAALLGLFGGNDANAIIVQEIRLPRTALAVLIGAGLGAAGAALQALLRNPLAEPGVIGISASSALGAVLVYYGGLNSAHALALPLGGLAGGLCATLLLYGLAAHRLGTAGLILAGVALNSLAGALTALTLSLVPNPYAAYEIFFWLMGSLADRSSVHVWLSAPFILVGLALLLHCAPRLDVLVLGEETADSLGVNVRRLRQYLVLGVALAVGPGVAVAGAIGFVGLLVPHVLRPWLSSRPTLLVPASALGGAVLTLAADLLVRSWLINGELKLGVITALLGAPLFLLLALRAAHPD